MWICFKESIELQSITRARIPDPTHLKELRGVLFDGPEEPVALVLVVHDGSTGHPVVADRKALALHSPHYMADKRTDSSLRKKRSVSNNYK